MSAEPRDVGTLQEALFEIGSAISPATRGAGLLARWLREHGIALAASSVESPASSAEAGTLDEAWKAAEAALPEGWSLWSVDNRTKHGGGWEAVAGWDGARNPAEAQVETGSGPTPAAALHALAAALRAVPA